MESSPYDTWNASLARYRIKTTNMLIGDIEWTEGEKALLFMQCQLRDSWSESTSTLYSAKVLERALDKHALALIRASEATDRYNRSLSIASWLMAFATLALLAVAVIELVK